MRLGLLTQWFDPEPGPATLPGVLARGLARRGHEVSVLTGLPNYPTGRLTPGYRMRARQLEARDDVRVWRVALYPSHDGSPVRRAANYGSFGLSAAVLGGPALTGLDALWVNYSPVTVAPAMWRARYAHGVPLVVHVADLWPDTLWASGFAPGARDARPDDRPDDRPGDGTGDGTGERLGDRLRAASGALAQRATRRGLDAWCAAMYASAARVTYISPGVHDILHARGVPRARLDYAPMWADEETFLPADDATREAGRRWRAQVGIDPADTLVLYAGALGHAQGLHTLVDAAARAGAAAGTDGTDGTGGADGPASAGRLRVVIAGSGVAETELMERAARQNAHTSVQFIGRVEQSRMPALMAGANACYIGLSADPLSRVTMPSKTQATMAAGRPIVVAADGDVARVVTEAGAGWATGSGDVAGLSAILAAARDAGPAERERRGRAGRAYYERMFAVSCALDRVEQQLAQAARAASPTHRKELLA